MKPFEQTHTHRDDPETSFAAAASAESSVAKHHRIILTSLNAFGPMTGEELSDFSTLDRYQIMRRMKELVKAGKVEDSALRRPGKTGRQQVVWRLV